MTVSTGTALLVEMALSTANGAAGRRRWNGLRRASFEQRKGESGSKNLNGVEATVGNHGCLPRGWLSLSTGSLSGGPDMPDPNPARSRDRHSDRGRTATTGWPSRAAQSAIARPLAYSAEELSALAHERGGSARSAGMEGPPVS